MSKHKRWRYKAVSIVLAAVMAVSVLPGRSVVVHADPGMAVSESVNLVEDGGFEAAGAAGIAVEEASNTSLKKFKTDSFDSGWQYYIKANSAKTKYEIVSGAGRENGYALKVSRVEGETATVDARLSNKLVAGGANLEAGATYKITAYIKAEGITNNNGYSRLNFTEYAVNDKPGTQKKITNLAQVKQANSNAVMGSTGGWVETTAEVVAQGTNALLELLFTNLDTGALYIDDISVVKVKDAPTLVTLNKDATTLKMNVTETEQLTATIVPETATQSITWNSDNTAVATVDTDGNVTAVAQGTANITASIIAASGYSVMSDVCVVTVEAPPSVVAPTDIELPSTEEITYVGESLQLAPKAVNEEATAGGWRFTSSDTNIATVDETTGIVTGVKAGTASIIITNDYCETGSGIRKTCNITVSDNLVMNGSLEKILDESVTHAANTAKVEDLTSTIGWRLWTKSGASMSYSFVEGGKTGGGHAIRIAKTDSNDITNNGFGVLLQYVGGLEIGATYKASVWIKPVDLQDGSSYAYAKLKFGAESDFVKAESNGSWVEKSVEFVAADVQQALEVHALRLQTGYVLVDNVSVIKTKDAPGPSITLNPETGKTTNMVAGDTQTLTATIYPPVSGAVISFHSDNETVATVDASTGLVTAVSAGEATITASCDQVESGTLKLTVAAAIVPPTGINLKREAETAFVGETVKLVPNAENADATEGGWRFASSDENIASVDELTGVVTGVAQGTCDITITNDHAPTLSKRVTVTVWKNLLKNGSFEADELSPWGLNGAGNTAVTDGTLTVGMFATEAYSGLKSVKLSTIGDNGIGEVRLNQNKIAVTPGATYKFIAKMKTEDFTSGTSAAYTLYCWKGDGANGNPSTTIVRGKVLDREVTAADTDWVTVEAIYQIPAEGAWVAAQMSFEGKGTLWIDDVAIIEWQPITQITLDTTQMYLELNEEHTLRATTLPEASLDHRVVFESDKPEIVSVDANGKMTALSLGEAVITVTALNGGLSTQCKVTVLEEYIPLTDLTMVAAKTLCMGSKEQLDVSFLPENASNKNLIWSSSNESVASVDAFGRVTAWSEGTADITVVGNLDITKTCVVTVRKSTTLTTKKAELITDYGKALSGDCKNYIVKNDTGSTNVTFTVFKAPANGTLTVNADGTFCYLPKADYDVAQKDTFLAVVAAGTETAFIEGEVTVNAVTDSLVNLLTGDTTMFITREELAAIKADMQNPSSVRYEIWNNTYKPYLETLLHATPPTFESHSDADNVNALWMRSVGDTTANLMWAYLLTDNEAYKTKCFEWAQASLDYPCWGTSTWYNEADLAGGHQAFALGLVYNWLYDELSETQRTEIAARLYEVGPKFVGKWGDSGQYLQNHLWISLSGLCSTAISLYIHAEDVAEAVGTEVETVKANCVSWIELVCDKIGYSFRVLPQDGSNHEGAAYHCYGLEYMLKNALLLKNNLEIDMLTGNAWLMNSSDYFSNVIVPKNSLNAGICFIDYADGNRSSWYGPSHLYRTLAGIYQDEKAQWIAEIFEDTKADLASSNFWLGLFFADSQVEAKAPLETNESNLYFAEDLGIAVARSDWSGNESMLFIRNGLPLGKTSKELIDHDVLRAGTNESHCDPDNNAVVLYSNGEYLLKSDGYEYKHTSNHSTLIVGDVGANVSADFTGQLGGNRQGLDMDEYLDLDYEPEFTVLEENDTYHYLVGNATEAYAPSLGLKEFERNIVFLREENVMLVVDDIKTLQDKALQLRWFPEYKNVSEAYGIYSVFGNKNIMKFYPFTTENTTTEFKEVDVYKTGGSTQKEQAFTQTLTGNAWQNAVAFSWGPTGTAQTSVRYLAGNANEHKFEVNEKVYIVNVADNTVTVESGKLPLEENEWVSDSSLSQILFNSIALEEFKSDTYHYTVEKFWKVKDLTILPVPTAPNATAKVEWDGKCPGTVKIICTSENGKNVTEYTIDLTNENGLLDIMEVSATMQGTYPETFMYDSIIQLTGNDKTWAVLNLPKVTFDLGALAEIEKIDAAFNNSSIRSTYFNLWISEDGTEWTALIEDGESPITETGLKTDYQTLYHGEAVRARYVRVDMRSHSASGKDNVKAVNSIQEISFYGKMIYETRTNVQVNITEVPEELQDTYQSISGIENEMLTAALQSECGFKADRLKQYLMNIVLQVKIGDEWLKASEEQFPEEGIQMLLPYPEGTNKTEFDFAVLHMLASGPNKGQVEVMEYIPEEGGLRVTFRSLSPVSIVYQAKTGQSGPTPTPAAPTPTPTPAAPTPTPTPAAPTPTPAAPTPTPAGPTPTPAAPTPTPAGPTPTPAAPTPTPTPTPAAPTPTPTPTAPTPEASVPVESPAVSGDATYETTSADSVAAKTGDNSQMMLWIWLLAGTAILGTVVIWLERKNK